MKTVRVRRKRNSNQGFSGKGFFANGPSVQEKQNPFFSSTVNAKSEEEATSSQLQKAEDKKEEESKVSKQEEEKKDEGKIQGKEEEKDKVSAQKDEEKKDIKTKENAGDEKKDEKISAKFEHEIADAEFESSLRKTKGSGTPLPDNIRKEVEGIFKTSFKNVKIHTGNDAVNLCKRINAQAFTHGNDIYFNQGKFNPETSSGKHLLIHELTHIVQHSNMEE